MGGEHFTAFPSTYAPVFPGEEAARGHLMFLLPDPRNTVPARKCELPPVGQTDINAKTQQKVLPFP